MRDDELLRSYLLGELTGEDAEVLEERLIQDDDLFERAEAMEAELLEEHVHGGLTAAQRVRIERHLAFSGASRSQLAMVRGLDKVAAKERSWWRILAGLWEGTELSRPSVRALAAAMLLIAAGAGWLDYRTFHFQKQIEQMAQQRFERHDEKPPVAPPPPRILTGGDTIAGLEPTPAPAPPAVVSWAFELALTAFRGPEDHAQQVHIPAGTERVDIQLPLNQEDAAKPSFQVVLRTGDGQELIRRTDLQPVRAGDGAVLVLPVEAKRLPPGRYAVEVYGENENDGLGFPEFQVLEPSLK